MHPHKTGRWTRLLGALFGIAAAMVHAFAYGAYASHVLNGEIDANIVSWALFACEFLVLAVYRDFTNDWAKDLLYVICAFLGFGIFVMVCVKMYLTGTSFQAQFDTYNTVVVIVNLFVLFMWMRFRDKDAPGVVDWLLQATIILDFIPIVRSTWDEPTREWALPWAIWTGAYVLQYVCVRLRWDGRGETETTTLHYIVWHAVMFGIIYTGTAH